MSNKKAYNSFKGGMVIDSDPSIKNPDTYDYAENFRFVADSKSNTGVLYTPESSALIASAENLLQPGTRILGHCVIRNYLVLFIRESTPGGWEESIIRYNINNDSISDKFTLFSPGYSFLTGEGSSVNDSYISTVGRYDSDSNIRVYFATKGKPLRSINITEAFNSSEERLDLIPSSTLNPLSNPSVIPGKLEAGKVQYAYSLYKRNGQESSISTLTRPLPVYSMDVDTAISGDIKGNAEVDVNTGKGFNLRLSLDASDYSYFDYIRLYRVHYKEYGQTPNIYIINDFIISGQSEITMADTGEASLGEITVEDFSILSSFDFNAHTVAEKDNRLFAANIEDNTFDVEFDARAYRFTKNTLNTCELYSSYDGVYDNPDYIINGSDFTVVDNTIGGSVTSWEDIPKEAACVNPFNDYEYWEPDTSIDTREFAYKASTFIKGGSGPNVSYSFSTTDLNIDKVPTIDNPNKYGGDEDYSNPLACQKYTGYNRNETYRFGIEFFNIKGQKSSVKWIGDIRMPYIESSSPTIAIASTETVTARVLGVEFTINNIPTGVTGYRIVRVKRTENDKCIVTAGMASLTYNQGDNGEDYTTYPAVPIIKPDTTNDGSSHPFTGSGNINKRIIAFIDPIGLFEKRSVIKDGYWLENAGIIEEGASLIPNYYPDKSRYNAIKYRQISPIDPSIPHTFKYELDIDNCVFFKNANNPLEIKDFPNSAPLHYQHKAFSVFYNNGGAGIPLNIVGEAPSCNIIDLIDEDFDTTQYQEVEWASSNITPQLAYTYIVRNNTSRYNGYTYSARNNNEYIPCGNITPSSTSSREVYGGDTYINYFNYVNCIYADTIGGQGNADRYSNHVTFIVESPYNLSLRHDNHYTKISEDSASFLVTERGSSTQRATSYGGTDYYLTQEEDLYLYNTVYSQEQSVKYNYSLDKSSFINKYDNRVIYSDLKYSNELIDSWARFRPNNFLEVSSQYGPIGALSKYNNDIYFTQSDSFGQLFINQRSLVNDDNLGSLSLGTGGVLDNYKYITDKYGTSYKKLISSTNDGIYFYDPIRKVIAKFSNKGLQVISDVEGLRFYARNLTLGNTPLISFNSGNNEVYFGLEDNKILVYSNFLEKFIGVYDIEYTYLMDLNKFFAYSDSRFLYGMYLNSSSYGSFNINADYIPIYTDSTLTVTNSSDFPYTKVFDNLFWFSTCTTPDTVLNNTTFDKVECWNDYQYTGSIDLDSSKLRRMERKWHYAIDRNIVNDNGAGTLDIFDPSNHNTSNSFGERMRGEYLTTKFTYNNSASKGMLSIPYVGLTYRQSKR